MNIENLAKLRDFLFDNREAIKSRFDIGYFFESANRRNPWFERNHPTADELEYLFTNNECGTTACAVGWGPSVIPTIPEDYILDIDVGGTPRLCYPRYSRRVFLDIDDCRWDWMFNEEWESVDNTPEGAAFRIDYLLKGNDLESFTYDDGLTPCFWPDNAEDEVKDRYNTLRNEWLASKKVEGTK
jgi:hypothetical protein